MTTKKERIQQLEDSIKYFESLDPNGKVEESKRYVIKEIITIEDFYTEDNFQAVRCVNINDENDVRYFNMITASGEYGEPQIGEYIDDETLSNWEMVQELRSELTLLKCEDKRNVFTIRKNSRKRRG